MRISIEGGGVGAVEVDDEAIGRGGEGKIHKVLEGEGLVLKRYHDEVLTKRGAELEKKIRAMVANPPKGYDFCWAKGVALYEGRFVGFLMDEVDRQHSLAWSGLSHSQTRRLKAPDFGVRQAIRACANLSLAMANAHEARIIIGDVNESNVLVFVDATVKVIDCDSMQMVSDAGTFYCGVGKPEFTARELTGVDFKDVPRTEASDVFGLGVLMFMMLSGGSHPYDGVVLDGRETTITERINEGLSPFYNPAARGKIEAPTRVAFGAWDKRVQEVVGACVAPTPQMRPSARAVFEELSRIEKELITCELVPTHAYTRVQGGCGWCEHAQKVGSDPFGTASIQVGMDPVSFEPGARVRALTPLTSQSGSSAVAWSAINGPAGTGATSGAFVGATGGSLAGAASGTGPGAGGGRVYRGTSWFDLAVRHPGVVLEHLMREYPLLRVFEIDEINKDDERVQGWLYWMIGVVIMAGWWILVKVGVTLVHLTRGVEVAMVNGLVAGGAIAGAGLFLGWSWRTVRRFKGGRAYSLKNAIRLGVAGGPGGVLLVVGVALWGAWSGLKRLIEMV